MAKIDGFGKWTILDNDGGINRSVYGIIDLEKKLFIETDANQNPVGKVLNLSAIRGWELVKEGSEESKRIDGW